MLHSFLVSLPPRSVQYTSVAHRKALSAPLSTVPQFLAECLARSSTQEILIKERRLWAGCRESWGNAPEDAGKLRGETGRLGD